MIMNDRNWGGARKGAGRKPTGKKTKFITLTLSIEQAEELKRRADSVDMTVSRFIVKYLHLPDEKKPGGYNPQRNHKLKKVLYDLSETGELAVAEGENEYGSD